MDEKRCVFHRFLIVFVHIKSLGGHPFFTASSLAPSLATSQDWAALLPTVDDEPLTPLSVATQDSWSFEGPQG